MRVYTHTQRALGEYSGFTMIELLMVIILVGLLGAVALPKFLDFRQEAKVAAAQHLKQALMTGLMLQYKQAILKCNSSPETLIPIASIEQNDITAGAGALCTTAQIPNEVDRKIIDGPIGPGSFPINPMTGLRTIGVASPFSEGGGYANNGTCAASSEGPTYGWCYDPTTGNFFAANDSTAGGLITEEETSSSSSESSDDSSSSEESSSSSEERQACSTNDQCESGYCSGYDGFCHSGQPGDLCGRGTDCVSGNCNRSWTCTSHAGGLGNECADNSSCSSGYCGKGACTTGSVGSACWTNSACSSGWCSGNNCTTGALGQNCQYAQNCQSGYCSGWLETSICTTGVVGQPCMAGHNCQSGNCISNLCQ